MSPRTGWPPKAEGRKAFKLQIRMNEEELQRLDKCARKLNLTRTDVVNAGIQLVEQRLDWGEK